MSLDDLRTTVESVNEDGGTWSTNDWGTKIMWNKAEKDWITKWERDSIG